MRYLRLLDHFLTLFIRFPAYVMSPSQPNASSILLRKAINIPLLHFAKIFAFSLDGVKLCFVQSGVKEERENAM